MMDYRKYVYLSERKDQKVAARKREQRRVLMQRYKKQRKEEVSARFTGKSPFGAANGRKMKAFSLTEYGKCTRFWLVYCLLFCLCCCFFFFCRTHLLGVCIVWPVSPCTCIYIVLNEWSVLTNNRGQESRCIDQCLGKGTSERKGRCSNFSDR